MEIKRFVEAPEAFYSLMSRSGYGGPSEKYYAVKMRIFKMFEEYEGCPEIEQLKKGVLNELAIFEYYYDGVEHNGTRYKAGSYGCD